MAKKNILRTSWVYVEIDTMTKFYFEAKINV